MKFTLLALVFFVATHNFAQTVPPTAAKVLEFSQKNFGKKVDRGECWDLASFALNYANAEWSAPFNFGEKINYKKEGFEAGEIIQFSNVKFVYPLSSFSFPQHTAIVYKVNKSKVTIYHQNYDNKKKVDTLTVDFNYMKSGKIDVYKPKGKN